MKDDYVTSTPEDAAIFERMHGREDEPDSLFEPDDPCEPYDEFEVEEELDRALGIVHPPWCPLPPGHRPYWVSMKLGLYEPCEPMPSDA